MLNPEVNLWFREAGKGRSSEILNHFKASRVRIPYSFDEASGRIQKAVVK